MIKKLLNFLSNNQKYYKCNLFPEPITKKLTWQYGALKHYTKGKASIYYPSLGLRTGNIVWTPDGFGYIKSYDNQTNMVSVYMHRPHHWKEFEPKSVFRIVGTIPGIGKQIPLSAEDYKYMVLKTDFIDEPAEVRLTTHGKLTLSDNEKRKRQLIAYFNSAGKTTGRKLLLGLLDKKINVKLN